MSLLLDENLSPRLTVRLASLFPGLIPVRDAGLKEAGDQKIWNRARGTGYTVVNRGRRFRGSGRSASNAAETDSHRTLRFPARCDRRTPSSEWDSDFRIRKRAGHGLAGSSTAFDEGAAVSFHWKSRILRFGIRRKARKMPILNDVMDLPTNRR